ncbi:MAG: hypothetical protein WKG01_10255 [Kofleriaceae bacterium]
MRMYQLMFLLAGCTSTPAEVGIDPDEVATDDPTKADSASGLPDVQCAGAPDAGGPQGFRHFTSKITAAIADPRHRGIDLVATATATQELRGDASYGTLDKAIEDEYVDLYACRAGEWRHLGRTRTDDDGRFALRLTDTKRPPIGLRYLYVSGAGDRTGARFLGLVAPEGTALAVSDVDGTLSKSELAFGSTIIFGADIPMHDGAPAVFHEIAARGYQPLYLSARPRAWTEVSRQWFAAKGMPRGPVRFAPGFVLPGSATVEYKRKTLEALAGFDLAVGIGNRASDVEAYQSVQVPAEHTFVKLPEYADELQPLIDAGAAAGFAEYAELDVLVDELPQR